MFTKSFPKWYPRFSMSNQTGVKAIAIVHSGLAIYTVLAGASSAVSGYLNGNVTKQLNFGILLCTVGSFYIGASILLFHGAKTKSYLTCMIWLGLHTLFLMVALISTFTVTHPHGWTLKRLTKSLCFIIPFSYFWLVLWQFSGEIETKEKDGNASSPTSSNTYSATEV